MTMLIIKTLNGINLAATRMAARLLEKADKLADTAENIPHAEYFWFFLYLSKFILFLVKSILFFGTKTKQLSQWIHHKLILE